MSAIDLLLLHSLSVNFRWLGICGPFSTSAMKKSSADGGDDERAEWDPCAQSLPVAQ